MFDLAPDMVQLNHGSYGAVPRPVRRAQDLLRAAVEADPIGFMERVPARVRRVCAEVGAFVGARGEDLVLVENTTAGISAILRSLDLRPGDRLVTTDHVYGAVRHALRFVAERAGAVVSEAAVPFPVVGAVDLRAVHAAIPGARLVVIDLITSATGLILPVAEVIAACRAHGVPVLVDAAHGPGHLPLDLGRLGADWVVGNLHKWAFAPRGAALLWASPARQPETFPLVLSHGLPLGWPASFDWAGTRDPSAFLAVPAGLAVHRALGGPDLMARNRALAAEMAAELAAAWGTELPSPADARGAMATLDLPRRVPETDAVRLHDALRRRGVQVPCVPFGGRTWVRISAQVYNRREDYGRLVDAVRAELG